MTIFGRNFEIEERCKGVHCVNLGESFPTSIYLQNLASIQPRTSLGKFARSPRTDPSGQPEQQLEQDDTRAGGPHGAAVPALNDVEPSGSRQHS